MIYKDLSLSRRNTRLLMIMTSLQNAMFVLPVLIPYYRDEMGGIGFREFMIGEAFFAATVILMEVPTGWISDIWHRKRTMMLSFVMYILGWSLLFKLDGLTGAIIAQSTIGIAVSLISGTNSAFLYDSLLADGREGEFRRLEGMRTGAGLYSLGLCAIAGGFLYEIDHRIPLLLMVVANLLALGAAFFMHEPPREMRAVRKHPLADMLETMRYALHGHKEVAGIILFATVVFCATKILMWAQQPYYMQLGLPESWFGVLSAAGWLLGGFGSHIGHIFDGRLSNRAVFTIMFGIVIASCLIAGLTFGYHVIPFLLIGSVMYGFCYPRVQHELNNLVDSTRRATILSTASLMVNLLFIPLGSAMGWISDHAGLQAGILLLGVFVSLAGGAGLALVSWHKKRNGY